MRFIIVSVPSDPLARIIRNLQHRLSVRTGAIEALRYSPHVTLRTGIVCPDDAVTATVQAFLEHAGALTSACIRTTGLVASGYRDSTGVERGFLGYKVELTPELVKLHQGLLEFIKWQKGPQGVFDPHISLCYYDITTVTAQSILDEYHTELEQLEPAWELTSVELHVAVDGSWHRHAGTTLVQRSAERA